MVKHSFEFKKKGVLEYLDEKGGTPYLSKKYGLGSNSQLRKWIRAYQKFGDEGLMHSRKNNDYSLTFKLHMAELYLPSEVSYQELALSQGINNPTTLVKWVNAFRISGPDALRSQKKGRKKTLNSDDINNTPGIQKANEVDADTGAEHIKELEDELLKRRIENAFLKELRRLRLADESKMRDVQESSTVSE